MAKGFVKLADLQSKKSKRKLHRIKPVKGDHHYHQVWRVVDGAVKDCFAHHPEYIPSGKQLTVIRQSIVKRVVGGIMGYASEMKRRGDPGNRTGA